MKSFECIVIGAGVEGCATALALQRDGHKTVLIEQHPLNHTSGSSHGGSRITRYAYGGSRPIYTAMMNRGFQGWDELERQVGQQLYRNTGLLWIERKETGECPAMAKLLQEMGHPGELLNNEEISARYPFLHYDSSFESIFDPRAGVLYADKCMLAMQTMFKHFGGEIVDNCEVTGVKLGRKPQITTSKGTFECSKLSVCVGGWLEEFASTYLGLQLGTKMVRVHVTYWTDQSKGQVYSADNKCPTVIIVDGNVHLYGLPSDEIEGEFKLCNHSGHMPHLTDSEAYEKSVQPVVDHMNEHFTGLDTTKPSTHQPCKYTNTSTDHMIISKHPQYDNVAIAGGMMGQGFKLALVVGETMTKLLYGQPIEYDLRDFAIQRSQCTTGKM